MSVFANTGQDCCARSRMFVERSIYDPFVERFVAATKKLMVGDPAKTETQLGPLVSAGQRASVEEFIADARKRGSKFACGGGRPTSKGFYLEPTVLLDVGKTTAAGARKSLARSFASRRSTTKRRCCAKSTPRPTA